MLQVTRTLLVIPKIIRIYQLNTINFQMQAHSFIGTVAFVEEEELFYGRVKSGWKSFTVICTNCVFTKYSTSKFLTFFT